MSERKIRMLFFPRETFPTERVRLTTLFGRELLGRGHAIDVVMQAVDSTVRVGRHDWSGRSVWVGATDTGDTLSHRARKNLLNIMHDLRWLMRAKSNQYDSILVSDKYVLATIASVVARLRGMEFYFWLTFPYHEADATLGSERIARNPRLVLLRGFITKIVLYRWIIPLSHHVFVQSSRMADDFAARGTDKRKLTPIVTGIDLAQVSPRARPPERSRSRTLTVGYLGTLVPERRLEVLVDMLAELNQRGLHARLLLVGDGAKPEDRRSLQERARLLGVESQLEITGFLPRRDALALICTVDVCISPFHPSPILDVASPTKLIEYMALGLPVVANAHPDQSLVLRESRAGVCVPWGARHFARAVHWLAKRSDDELIAMASRGRDWVATNRTYSKIADIFEDACFRSAGRR